MKAAFTLSDTLDILEKLVNGEPLPVDFAELGEAILEGEPRAHHARTILVFSKHPDKRAAWKRFVSSSIRIYGVGWRTHYVLFRPVVTKLDQNRVLACTTPSCMELAWARTCDQCLVRQLGW